MPPIPPAHNYILKSPPNDVNEFPLHGHGYMCLKQANVINLNKPWFYHKLDFGYCTFSSWVK